MLTFATQKKESAIEHHRKVHFDKIVFVFICLGWQLAYENKPTPFFNLNRRGFNKARLLYHEKSSL
jgi:hypothetical protein